MSKITMPKAMKKEDPKPRQIFISQNYKPLESRAAQLAGDDICYGNWKFPKAEEAFPSEPWLRCVDKYYPDAIGGPLLIDEAMQPHQLIRAEKKQKVLHEMGLRYVIIKPEMTLTDCQMELERVDNLSTSNIGA